MKRMHVHISVDDLSKSISFYSQLFGVMPTIQKDDYAKWMLEDPRVNFAISRRGETPGLNHLGIQVEHADELAEIETRLRAADLATLSEHGETCCYAKSDKHWVQDPSGIAWEAYHTLDSAPTFHANPDNANDTACCAPVPEKIAFISRKSS